MANTHTPTPAGIHSIVHRYPNHTKKRVISSPKYSRMSSMGCSCAYMYRVVYCTSEHAYKEIPSASSPWVACSASGTCSTSGTPVPHHSCICGALRAHLEHLCSLPALLCFCVHASCWPCLASPPLHHTLAEKRTGAGSTGCDGARSTWRKPDGHCTNTRPTQPLDLACQVGVDPV
jgi:hypothetical protein